jgi:predicted TIM-barrel enzyme
MYTAGHQLIRPIKKGNNKVIFTSTSKDVAIGLGISVVQNDTIKKLEICRFQKAWKTRNIPLLTT